LGAKKKKKGIGTGPRGFSFQFNQEGFRQAHPLREAIIPANKEEVKNGESVSHSKEKDSAY